MDTSPWPGVWSEGSARNWWHYFPWTSQETVCVCVHMYMCSNRFYTYCPQTLNKELCYPNYRCALFCLIFWGSCSKVSVITCSDRKDDLISKNKNKPPVGKTSHFFETCLTTTLKSFLSLAFCSTWQIENTNILCCSLEIWHLKADKYPCVTSVGIFTNQFNTVHLYLNR